MRNSVDDVQLLLGSRIRDARRDRMGRIVGVDQTRDVPALLIAWAGTRGVVRVDISRDELRGLLAARQSISVKRPATRTSGGRDDDAESTSRQKEIEEREPLATGTATPR